LYTDCFKVAHGFTSDEAVMKILVMFHSVLQGRFTHYSAAALRLQAMSQVIAREGRCYLLGQM
jgi:hypothetical protein